MAKHFNRNASPFIRALAGSGLWLVIAAAVVLQVVSVLLILYTRKELTDNLEVQSEMTLYSKISIIRNTLSSAEATLQEHLWDIDNSLGDPDAVFGAVERLISVNPGVQGGCIAFAPGYYPSKGELFEPYVHWVDGRMVVEELGINHDYSDNVYFRRALDEGKSFWSDPYRFSGDTLKTIITYSYPLTDAEGSIAGVCGLDMDVSWLADTLNARRALPSSYSLMLTKDGSLVAGPSKSHHSKEDISTIVSMVSDPSVRKKSSRTGRSQMFIFDDKTMDDDAFVYFITMKKEPNWQIVEVSYDDEVYAPVYRMMRISVLLIVVGLLVIALILYRFARNADNLHKANVRQERLSSELQIAGNIQNEMLPKDFPPFPERGDLDIWGSINPAKEVGGDLFDFFIRSGKLFFCIGDVSGKGVPSAMVMSAVHFIFRMSASHDSDPAFIMKTVNEQICRENESGMFVTLFVGVLHLRDGRLDYCNAGHDHPVLLGGGVRQLDAKANLPVGTFDDTVFESQTEMLSPGTTLFLYTDGLTEAKDSERRQYSLKRLLSELGKIESRGAYDSHRLQDAVLSSVHSFVGDAPQSDDLTILAIRYLGGPSKLQNELTIPAKVKEVPRLGQFVKGVMSRLDVPDVDARRIQLAVEETVVNVCEYAYPAGTEGKLTVRAEGDAASVIFTVIDDGMPFDPTAVGDADTTLSAEDRPIGGLGIHLVRNLMDSLSYERLEGQNVLKMTKKL